MTPEELFTRVRSDGFPYQKLFLSEEGLFDRLCQTKDEIKNESYFLRSYLPKGKSFIPSTFGNFPSLKNKNKLGFQYHNTKPLWILKLKESYVPNLITDLYVEDIRLQAKRKDQNMSTLEAFNDDKILLEWCKGFLITGFSYEPLYHWRNYIYTQHSEASLFPISWARTIISFLFNGQTQGKTWLDISAGWGDRLFAAISMKMCYIGFDPSTELKDRYKQIINNYGDPEYHQVFSEPFEIQGWNFKHEPSVDILFSSPPFFDIEIYPGENQSIQNFSSKDIWLNSFMFKSLYNAWKEIKVNGFFCLHIGDSKMENTNFTEQTILFIEENLPLASYKGVIGVAGAAGKFVRPLWIFKKEVSESFVGHWASKFPRKTLEEIYPGLLNKDVALKFNEKKSPYFNLDGKIID